MSKIKVLVIDMGLGNLGSIISSLLRLGYSYEKLKSPPSEALSEEFSHAILPGVGSFDKGMIELNKSGYKKWLTEYWSYRNNPLLGICLGMQLLASFGYEGAQENQPIAGLNLIPGNVEKLTSKEKILLPHIGWNEVNWVNQYDTLSKDLPLKSDFYFVHSYHFKPEKEEHIIAKTKYGKTFCSVVKKDSCIGVQFHPEKSQKIGNLLLKNFFV